MMPIRVLHLFSSFSIEGPLGGVARFVVDLCRNFDRTQVVPICSALWDYQTEFDIAWRQRVEANGIETIVASIWNEEKGYQSCVSALRGMWSTKLQSVDVIHSHGEFSDLAAILLRRRFSAKAIVRTVHNEREWAKRPLYGKLFSNFIYIGAFDLELGVSQQVVKNLNSRSLARWRQPALVAVNAINSDRFENFGVNSNEHRQRLNIPLDATVIGSVGRLVPQKGYDILLEAFALLLKRKPNVYLVLIGDGFLRESLQELAISLQVDHRVIFTGSQSNIETLYPIMDIFISSSRWEGLPTVIMESMAAGTPVIATDVSGSRELVEDGVTGLLVASEDIVQLNQAMLRLLSDQELAKSFILAAKQRITQQFSIRNVAVQYSRYYQKLIGSAIDE